MTWTNLFDLGACRVQVLVNAETALDEVISTGGSASFTAGDYSYELAVDGNGAVSVSGPGFGGYDMEVRVVPQYAHDFAARVKDVVFWGVSTASAKINDVDGNSVHFSSIDPPSPDPCDLYSLTGSSEYVAVLASPMI